MVTEITFYISLVCITVVSMCSYLLFGFLPNFFSWFEKLLANIWKSYGADGSQLDQSITLCGPFPLSPKKDQLCS